MAIISYFGIISLNSLAHGNGLNLSIFTRSENIDKYGLISLFIFAITLHYTNYLYQNDLHNANLAKFSELSKNLLNRRYIIRFDNQHEAIPHICASISNANIVRNTFVNYDVTSVDYSEDNKMKIVFAMKKFLSKDKNRWHDVISNDSEDYRSRIFQLKDKSGNIPNNLSVNKIRYNLKLPIMNFLTVDRSAVYFGFAGSVEEGERHVFLSLDEKIVASFIRLHRELSENKTSLRYDLIRSKFKYDINEYNDTWIIVSIEIEATPYDAAGVAITYLDGDKIQIDGRIFNEKKERIVKFDGVGIRNNKIENNISIKWEDKEKYDYKIGIFNFKINSEDELYGIFINLTDKTFTNVIGKKLNQSDKENYWKSDIEMLKTVRHFENKIRRSKNLKIYDM